MRGRSPPAPGRGDLLTTLTQLEDRVYFPLRDPDRDYITEPEVREYLNSAIRDLCERERIYEVEVIVTTTDGAFPLPEDVVQLRWAQWGSHDVNWVNPDILRDWRVTEPQRSIENVIGTVIEDQVRFHPMPADGTEISIAYYALAPELVTGADVLALKRNWEDKLVDYARGMCYLHLGENDLADRFQAQYEQGLRERPGNLARRLPGRVNLAVQMTPWDLIPDSIHRA